MALAVLWVLVSLVAAGIALTILFSVNIERAARDDLDAAMLRLAAVVLPGDGTPVLSAPLPDPRYTTPFGGRYWQVEALRPEGGTARSRSLWDFVIASAHVDNGLYTGAGPDGRELLLLTRRIDIDEPDAVASYRITVAIDNGPMRAAATQFAIDVTQVLVVLGILITLAAWLLIKLGLSPLLSLRKAIEAVRRGAHPQLEGRFPSELEPLVHEVNTLIEARDVMMDRARSRASDLAHGLKTPLAAMHGLAERLRDKGSEAEAGLLEQMSFEMSERVDYQMRLAALRVRTSAHASRAPLNAAVLRTLAVLKKTGRGEALHWVADLPADLMVDIHRQDLMELVGVTLENATKWATSRIVVHTRRDGDFAVLEISDDGPGIPDEQIDNVGVRGKRLDQSLPGTGLGLAIAMEILDINRGTMALGRAPIGGLSVMITLPLSLSED